MKIEMFVLKKYSSAMRVCSFNILLFALAIFTGYIPTSFSAPETTLVLVGGGNLPPAALRRIIFKAGEKPIFILPWATSKPKETYDWVSAEVHRRFKAPPLS